jgi:hypothetical protein
MRFARRLLVVPLCLGMLAALGGVASASSFSGTFISSSCVEGPAFTEETAPYLTWAGSTSLADSSTLQVTGYHATANAGNECNPSEAQVDAHKITIVEHVQIETLNVKNFSCDSFTVSWPPGISCNVGSISIGSVIITNSNTCPAKTAKGLSHCTDATGSMQFHVNSGKIVGAQFYYSGLYYNNNNQKWSLNMNRPGT